MNVNIEEFFAQRDAMLVHLRAERDELLVRLGEIDSAILRLGGRLLPRRTSKKAAWRNARREAIVVALANGPLSSKRLGEIVYGAGDNRRLIGMALNSAHRAGAVIRLRRGVYALPDGVHAAEKAVGK